ncbi:FAD-dependent oxidoreductase [Desulfogranum mediterraneum]|uniref:FAD-dependent oxidoreductase n=1 Tax=Desulfogranum mediterraneum TaxID=160661 RepID=UPI000424AE15|nr:FAD-dependent oxidoreductase [Desulfogranum mediterraneum]
MSKCYDVVIIGAGPAGINAGATLAEMGLQVVLLDEQQSLGGQIYRNISHASAELLADMGAEYQRGRELVARFEQSGAGHEPGATVWHVEADGHVYYSKEGTSHQLKANYVLVATGAMERPVPFPGWNLPGVMGAGAVNNLAKEAGLVPDCEVALVGSGPLLLLEASLLIKKGVRISTILETTPKLPPLTAVAKLPPALKRMDFLTKGLKMVSEIKRSGAEHYKGVTKIKALGKERVETVEAYSDSEQLHFPAGLLLTHFGVIPNTHIFRLIGCHLEWNQEQRYWFPKADQWGRTNFEKIFAAGDGAGVRGALAAEYRGELAALELARCLGVIPTYERDLLARPIREAILHDHHPRPFVDAVYAPLFSKETLDKDTVLCRCEQVRVQDVRKAVQEGVRDVNEVKIVTRCGMGPCQGRMCGPALAEVMAAELSAPPERMGTLTVRPPLKPIPLEEVATMELEGSAAQPADLFKNQSK